MFFSYKTEHRVLLILMLAGAIQENYGYSNALEQLQADYLSNPAIVHDTLWSIREGAFKDTQKFAEWCLRDQPAFNTAKTLFFKKITATLSAPETIHNPLLAESLYTIVQGQEITKEIADSSSAKGMIKKIKKYKDRLKEQKLEHREGLFAPYIINLLANQALVELDLQRDEKKQKAYCKELLQELLNNQLPLYSKMLEVLFEQILVQKHFEYIPSHLAPILIAKSLLAHNFNVLRDIEHYESLQKQYPDGCDQSYFYHIRYLNDLMQQDETAQQQVKHQILHMFYTLCAALHQAADKTVAQ